MNQPPGHNLAHLNWGRLKYGWDDPRVAPFVEALDLVNGAAARSPGFVWRLSDEDMEAAQLGDGGPFGADPFVASTLSLWSDGPSFANYVLNSIHGRFMTRASDWFRPGESDFVLWWVPDGSRPTIEDGLAAHARMTNEGPGPYGFGWTAIGQSDRVSAQRAAIP